MAYRFKEYPYNKDLTLEENTLLDRLYKLRLSGMAEALEKQFLNPNADLERFFERITDIINMEWDQRQSNKFNRLLRNATLKYPKADLDERLYEPERMLDTHAIELLAKCEWIDSARNLLVTGSSGAGKTYVANALCISALHSMKTVKYIRASTLINECRKISETDRYLDYLNLMTNYDLLVIDDFGLMPLDTEACRSLFEVIESRDCRKSTMIISQFPVSSWWDLFGDDTYADACLSRMTFKAHRLEFNGADLRKER